MTIPSNHCSCNEHAFHELEGLRGVLIDLRLRDVRKHVEDLAFGVDQNRCADHIAALRDDVVRERECG